MARSREEIIADMVAATLEPTRKTIIMYKANFSYTQLQGHLNWLSNRQMIESRKGMWVTTERGRAYLRGYQQITQMIT